MLYGAISWGSRDLLPLLATQRLRPTALKASPPQTSMLQLAVKIRPRCRRKNPRFVPADLAAQEPQFVAQGIADRRRQHDERDFLMGDRLAQLAVPKVGTAHQLREIAPFHRVGRALEFDRGRSYNWQSFPTLRRPNSITRCSRFGFESECLFFYDANVPTILREPATASSSYMADRWSRRTSTSRATIMQPSLVGPLEFAFVEGFAATNATRFSASPRRTSRSSFESGIGRLGAYSHE